MLTKIDTPDLRPNCRYLITKMNKEWLRKAARTPYLQPFWERLFDISLVGMNYWGAGLFSLSGELDAAKRLIGNRENAVFFDVGANDGKYSHAIAGILTKTAKIYSFEPFSTVYAKLCETTGAFENISCYNFGFGAEEDVLDIFYTPGVEELTSLYSNIPDRDQVPAEKVSIKTLDEFLVSEKIEKIDYLKIDVEGHELKVLEGAKQVLDEGRIDHVQFEFGESMVDSRVFFRDFWDLLHEDYTIYRILPAGLREIKSYHQRLELFYCVNFLAIRKSKDTA